MATWVVCNDNEDPQAINIDLYEEIYILHDVSMDEWKIHAFGSNIMQAAVLATYPTKELATKHFKHLMMRIANGHSVTVMSREDDVNAEN